LPFGLLVAHLLTVNALMFCKGTSELTPGACRFSHFIDRIVFLDCFISLCSCSYFIMFLSIFTGLLIVGLQIVFVDVFLAGYSGFHHDGFTASHDGFLHSLVAFVFLGKGTENIFF
jgi:hypothetical protein